MSKSSYSYTPNKLIDILKENKKNLKSAICRSLPQSAKFAGGRDTQNLIQVLRTIGNIERQKKGDLNKLRPLWPINQSSTIGIQNLMKNLDSD